MGRLRQLGAAVAFLAALAWLSERALGVDTMLVTHVDTLFRHGIWLLAVLVGLSLLARAFAGARSTR